MKHALGSVTVALVLAFGSAEAGAIQWPWSKRPKAEPATATQAGEAEPAANEVKAPGRRRRTKPAKVVSESLADSLYVPPKPAKIAAPVYPFELLAKKVTGAASVACMVDVDGKVIRTDVLETTRPEFAAALAAALEATEFAYATREGEPIASVLGFHHRFDLTSDASGNARTELLLLEQTQRQPALLGQPAALDRPVRPRAQRAPVFPTELQRKQREGEATVEFFLDEDGRPRLPRVRHATDPAFGYAAVQAVAEWTFDPPTTHGHPTVMRVAVPFYFRLQ